MNNSIKKIIISIILAIFSGTGLLAKIETLESLSYVSNEKITAIRNDIRKTVFTIKSARDAKNLPELKFYKYKVKKGENFWVIIARTSLDMDTMMSVNNISSPGEIRPGMTVFIPNMRGIILKNKPPHEIKKVLSENKVKKEYVLKANNSENLDKNAIFIPCGQISQLQRSLFLGTGFVDPLIGGKRTSGFGVRKNPFNKRREEFHKGIDIACPSGTKIFAARSGKVVFTGYQGGYGKLVIIQHELGYQSYYGHLSSYKVKPGDYVKAKELIAVSGNTGRSTGPHLHFEVRKLNRPVNPGLFIRK